METPPLRKNSSLGQSIGSLLKGHFLAGLLILIPLAVIGWILAGVLRTLWSIQDILPSGWQPSTFIDDPSAITLFKLLFTLLACLVIALGISTLGWASKHFFGRKILEFIGEIIQRIPVIRSVYSALDQLLKTFAAGGAGGQQFHGVVYVEYPRKGVWALAFVTGPARGPHAPPNHLNLYVPTTPNPTSGFHLIVPETDVRDSGLSVEDAFKTILSLGIAQPGEN